ncbi:Arginyl-tRNA--protein transferase 1 [Acorus calamus]|uniref:Arginyl-tRNA--protein transferase n=1 Tax=Acorus calamus TaxID=4465 RepID=A0AAV9DZH9_ACOCL|nr:Arginyl-tRNA--protein transferase 1 [Acorus calamus]
MQRFLDGTIDVKWQNHFKAEANSSKVLYGQASKSSGGEVPGVPISETSSSAGKCEENHKQNEIIRYLSNKIDSAVNIFIGNLEIPSAVQIPKAIVKRVTPQATKKLAEISKDLLYTCSISFQISASLRRSGLAEQNIPNENSVVLSPKVVAEKLPSYIDREGKLSGLSVQACNGYLNFYSGTGDFSVTAEALMHHSTGSSTNCKRSCQPERSEAPTYKKRKLELRMKRSSFDPEEFDLYRRYQMKVHHDKPEKVTETLYRRFLVDTPLNFVPPSKNHKNVSPCGFGSFHQQYVIDGKLVAVGVVDILPKCLSSKYLFWDPDLAALSLGKYSVLQEIKWVKEVQQIHCPTLEYYYLGYYIHSCNKMRYKAAYHPSELLCPLRYQWVPFDIARPLLDRKKYCILSDHYKLQDGELLTDHVSESSVGKLCLNYNEEDTNEASSDEDEEMERDLEDMDTDSVDEPGPEHSISMDDELKVQDVGNVMIDLHGSRVKFKDLQLLFGPINKKNLDRLELQLRRYVNVVGTRLSEHIIYHLE